MYIYITAIMQTNI